MVAGEAVGGVYMGPWELTDETDATVDDGMVTVLPGETHTFHVLGAAGAEPAALTDPRVLRSANQLLRHTDQPSLTSTRALA